MTGRIKLLTALFFIVCIFSISIVVPLTAFARTKVKFVIRFPWSIPQKTKVAIFTPVPPISIPTIVPTSTPTPTVIPSPTAFPSPTPESKKVMNFVSEINNEKLNNSDQEGEETAESYLLKKMNEYRRQNGLGEVGSDQATCDFAQVRAREIESNFSHDGFRSRISSGTLPYASYSYVNENIAQNSDFTKVIDSWIASPPHAENMRQNLSTACIRHSGEYYVFEGWRS